MNENILQFQELQQEIQHLYQNLEQLSQQRQQVVATIDAIDNILLVKDKEILTPLVNGIFFSAHLDDVKEFHVNVGNGIVVKKTPEDTKVLMQEQLSEMDRISKNITEQLGKKLESIQHIEGSLQDV